MSNDKDRLYILKEDRPIYKKIKEVDGDLSGKSTIDVFLIAMTIGFCISKKRIKVGGEGATKDGLVKEIDFNSTAIYLIESLAVKNEGNLEILLNKDEMYQIAEEYAAAGIKELETIYFENEFTFFKRMEQDYLIDAFQDQIGEKE